MKRILFLLTAVISFLSMNAEYMYIRILSEEDKTAELVCVPFLGDSKYPPTEFEIPSTVDWEGNEYTIESIGMGAFEYYAGDFLEKIVLPNTITNIDGGAFAGCVKLVDINLPKNLKRIGDYAFEGCRSLETLDFPDGLEEIGVNAFHQCSSLKRVLLPNSIKRIGAGSFYECENLEMAALGSGLQDIGAKSFVMCWNLLTIYSFATIPPHCNFRCFDSWLAFAESLSSNENRVTYVPGNSIGLYFTPKEEQVKQYFDYTLSDRGWMAIINYQPVADAVVLFAGDNFTVKEGESISIPYKLYNPGDVKIVKTDWTASNPVAAAVEEGMVTGLKAGECSIITLTITDASGQTYMAECSVEVAQSAKVNAVEGISASQPKVYDTKGIYRGNSNRHLSSGVYVIREGNESHKVVIP